MKLGELIHIGGIRGIVRYIGARGHIGVDMADGTFRVVYPSDSGVQRIN